MSLLSMWTGYLIVSWVLFPMVDDLKVHGAIEQEHDIKLLETSKAAFRAGLRFNPQKCHRKQPEIEYFCNVIGRQGVYPDPKMAIGQFKICNICLTNKRCKASLEWSIS